MSGKSYAELCKRMVSVITNNVLHKYKGSVRTDLHSTLDKPQTSQSLRSNRLQHKVRPINNTILYDLRIVVNQMYVFQKQVLEVVMHPKSADTFRASSVLGLQKQTIQHPTCQLIKTAKPNHANPPTNLISKRTESAPSSSGVVDADANVDPASRRSCAHVMHAR